MQKNLSEAKHNSNTACIIKELLCKSLGIDLMKNIFLVEIEL